MNKSTPHPSGPQVISKLFHPGPGYSQAEDKAFFSALPAALEEALPMNAAHRRDLPEAVAELSRILTTERSALVKPYWASPRLAAAYLHYFMPWNIIRLRALFSSLSLPEPAPLPPSLTLTGQKNESTQDAPAKKDAETPKEPSLLALDLGSGPLTVLFALWLAKPEWRTLPVTFLCLDISSRPLDLGRKAFYALSGGSSPWRIVPVKAGMESPHRHVRGTPQLIFSANMLNEWISSPNRKNDSPRDRLENMLEELQELSSPDAAVLFVEPGTRLGGKTIAMLREASKNEGSRFDTAEPCPHNKKCPLDASKTWCHFTYNALFIPTWLEELSTRAGLAKSSLSLSFMLLQKRQKPHKADAARIISAPFAVPGLAGQARYACTRHGLALLENAAGLPSGALIEIQYPANPRRDKKSGAWIA